VGVSGIGKTGGGEMLDEGSTEPVDDPGALALGVAGTAAVGGIRGPAVAGAELTPPPGRIGTDGGIDEVKAVGDPGKAAVG
jgi:hypothetical protein